MTNDIIRVLRVVEYIGPRQHVEAQVARSIHGERRIPKPEGDVVIRAATLGLYPEVLMESDVYTFATQLTEPEDLTKEGYNGISGADRPMSLELVMGRPLCGNKKTEERGLNECQP